MFYILTLLSLPLSSFCCLSMNADDGSVGIPYSRATVLEDSPESVIDKAKLLSGSLYSLDQKEKNEVETEKELRSSLEKLYPGVFPLAVQYGSSNQNIDLTEMAQPNPSPEPMNGPTIIDFMPNDTLSTTNEPSMVSIKPQEFNIGPYGPLTRVSNITECNCVSDIYNEEWCPYGTVKGGCLRDYLTLPRDSDSVFYLSDNNCSLHFECGSDYSLHANVYLPLGVYPQPSNLQKEINSAQANGFSTAFECSQEGKFELVFVSAKRRVVFVIHDMACVRRVEEHLNNESERLDSIHYNDDMKNQDHPYTSYNHIGFENPYGFKG